ncbi:hypothetical protein Ddye_000176 [Dipteronia dyeriana]|uniref:Endonuclease/exonuclease/phosphatase domain-containing protein n=1 Tax=Dipteronia dyeriana TaxID=168575 RepID=A0AAE0CSA6_9ROSI|nr:hypothetical protein Ddye_000176 [Dipteronia dyeriana]
MNIMVWNVQGLGNGRAFRTLINLKQYHNSYMMILFETKVSHVVMESVRVKLGFGGKLVVNNVWRSGGVGMLWNEGVSIDLISYTQSQIDVKVISHGSMEWRLTGFYSHPDESQRCHSWTLLKRLSELIELPWLCVGDLNEILCGSKKEGGLKRTQF